VVVDVVVGVVVGVVEGAAVTFNTAGVIPELKTLQSCHDS